MNLKILFKQFVDNKLVLILFLLSILIFITKNKNIIKNTLFTNNISIIKNKNIIKKELFADDKSISDIVLNSHNYIINLKDRPIKKLNVISQFENLNLKYEIVKGINTLNKKVYGKYRRSGAMGYKQTLEKLISNIISTKKDGYVTIFDDDILFSKNFEEELKNNDVPTNFDVLYLGASEWSSLDLNLLKEQSTLYYTPVTESDSKYGDGTCGSFACVYKISFLRDFYEYLKTQDDAYDRILKNFIKDKKSYVLFPNLVISNIVDSDIRENSTTELQMRRERQCWYYENYYTITDLDPLFSFAIITYNRSDYLKKTIEYILNQTINNEILKTNYFEIVIVDDNSVDDTQQIVYKLMESNPNIIYKKNSTNKGIPESRNIVNDLAKGSFIIVTDDDDIILNDRLFNILKKINSIYNKFCGVYSGWVDYNVEKDKIKQNKGKPFDYSTILYSGGVLIHPASCYRKDIISEIRYNEKIPYNSDWCLFAELARAGYKFVRSKTFGIIKINHPTTTTITKPKINYALCYRNYLLTLDCEEKMNLTDNKCTFTIDTQNKNSISIHNKYLMDKSNRLISNAKDYKNMSEDLIKNLLKKHFEKSNE